MKKCYVCNKDKSFNNYHKDMSKKDNLSGRCTKCKSIVDKKYREKIKAKSKKTISDRSYHYGRYKSINYNDRRRELHRKDPRIRLRGGCYARAKKKGLEFNLPTYRDLPKVPKFCPILGIPLVVGASKDSNGGGTDNSPSLDRIDNNIGYIKWNIQIISRKANQMKSNGTLEDIKKLYLYVKKQKEERS